MSNLDTIKGIVQESSDLSKKGDHGAALERLDRAIAAAIEGSDALGIRVLSRHASAIADHCGKSELARKYLENALPHSSGNPSIWFGIGKALYESGAIDQAKICIRKSYELATERRNETDKLLIETIESTWPEFRRTNI